MTIPATETGLADRLRRFAALREAMIGPDVPYLKSTVAQALLDAAQRIDFLEGENARFRGVLTAAAEMLRRLGATHSAARLRHSLQQNNDEKGA